MNSTPDIYHSKLLLFGEYGLMFDAMALSVPFPRFYGYLADDPEGLYKDSNQEIRKFFHYLASLKGNNLHYPFDLKHLNEDLENGLYFHSNIPFQYGLGSSGALVAALFSRYTASTLEKDNLSIRSLKEDMAILESYFHGKSSGLDPLVSYINQPLLLGPDKSIQIISLDLERTGWSVALIDTKTTGATEPLVQFFIGCMKLQGFHDTFHSHYIPANNGCIQSLLRNEKSSFFGYLKQLTNYELQHMNRMFPSHLSNVVKEALEEQVYIKLLGSGGGGYLLAFAPDEQLMDNWAASSKTPLIKMT